MTDIEDMLMNFDLGNANENESLMFYAIAALITIVENQRDEIKSLNNDLKLLKRKIK
jgi:hypothetical protein